MLILQKAIQHLGFWVWMGLVALAVLSFIYLGTFSRMMADDYCTAAAGMRTTPWQHTLWVYQEWSGAYTHAFMKAALAHTQPALHPWMTLLFIVLWGVVLTGVGRLGLIQFGSLTPTRNAFGLALVIVLATMSSAVSYQNLYWWGAIIPYTFPLISLTIGAGFLYWLFLAPRSTGIVVFTTIGLLVMVFVNGGISEIYVTLQIPLLFFGGIFAWWAVPKERRLQVGIVFGLLFFMALLSLIVVAIAPGNYVRRDALGATTPRLSSLILLVIKEAIKIASIAPTGLLPSFFAFAVPIAVSHFAPTEAKWANLPLPRPLWLWFGIIGIVGVTLMMAGLTTLIYAANVIEPRTLLPMRIAQVGMFAAWGYLCAVWLKRRFLDQAQIPKIYHGLGYGAGLIVLVLPLVMLYTNYTLAPHFQEYATSWDQQHAQINAAISTGANTIQLSLIGNQIAGYMNELGYEEAWVVTCIRDFYQVDVQFVQSSETN